MLYVLGNATIDEAMAIDAWPAPGHTVVVGAPRRDLGGKGANQAVVAVRAGARTRFVAAIGRDEGGVAVAEAIAAEGLDPENLVTVGHPTDRSLIFVHRDGENAIASVVGAAASWTVEAAEAAVAGLGPGDQLLMQGNLSANATRAAFALAKRQGAATIFNPSPLQPGFGELLQLVDLLVLNQGEAEALGGTHGEADVPSALRAAGAGTVVLTLGRRGAVFAGPGTSGHVEARPVSVVDTTGAGDTFMGVLVAALFRHCLPLRAAVTVANEAAAVTVGRPGTFSAFPSRNEIAAILGRGTRVSA